MRNMKIAAAALFLGGAGVLTFAVPAFAATAADTPVTVVVSQGTLGISAPTASVLLGTAPGSATAQTVTAQLGPVLVTDNRAGIAGWVATAGATAPSDGTGIPTSAMAYTPGNTTVVGTATVTGINLASMATQSTVETATAVTGDNTATWNPSIVVTIPAAAVAGTYSATITHSVS
jgi:hypothetical protein